MSSAIMSLLISHILTFVESELAKEEPDLLAALEADIKSLIVKLESMLSAKSPSVASVVNPALNQVSSVTLDAVQAAGDAIMADSAPQLPAESVEPGISTPQSVE